MALAIRHRARSNGSEHREMLERENPAPEERMRDEGRSSRLRRLLLAAALVVSPALITLGDLLTPSVDWNDQVDVVTTAAAESGQWQASTLVGMFGFMLFVPAGIAAAELVRRRKPGLAMAIVVAMGAGAMAVVASIGVSFTYAGARAADTTEVARFVEETENLGGFALLFPLFLLGPLGALLLAYGLWRTSATPVWVPVLLLLGLVATFAESTVATVGWAIVTVAMGAVAWAYLVQHRGAEASTAPS
jgi:hypothetical protein